LKRSDDKIRYLLKIKIAGLLLLACCFILPGCSTSGSARFSTSVFNDYQAEKNGLWIQFSPVTEKDKSIAYLNLLPAKYDLMPIFIAIVNKSASIKKIDTDETYLISDLENVKYGSMPVEKAVKMLQSCGWVPAVAFGFTGSVIAGAAEEEKDDSIYRKAFKPRILNPNCSGEGVIFFSVPKTEILNKEFVLIIKVEDIDNSCATQVEIPFKTR
jgi:hypothetical protein